MRTIKTLSATALFLLTSCFLGPPDTYSPELRLSIEAGGKVARVLTYGAPDPWFGQCADSTGGELLPFTCDESIAKLFYGFGIGEHQGLSLLPRGRFRYYSRLTSVEVMSRGKAVGTAEAKGKVAVAKYSMVAEWSRYINVNSTFETGPSASTPIQPDGKKTDLKKAEPALAKSSAVVFGIDYGVGVRVVLDVTIRGIDAEGVTSFGFGELAASIVTKGAEINVRYDTVGVRRDILPPNAPTNITSVNDLVNVQRTFYGAIDTISRDWNDAYKGEEPDQGDEPLEPDEGTGTGGDVDEEPSEALNGHDEDVDERLGKKFRFAPVAYYIYRSNLDEEIKDTCDRQVVIARLARRGVVSKRYTDKIRKQCYCERGLDTEQNCKAPKPTPRVRRRRSTPQNLPND